MSVYTLEKDDGEFLDVIGYAQDKNEAEKLLEFYFDSCAEESDGNFEVSIVRRDFGLTLTGEIVGIYKIFSAEKILEKIL